jgi:hypothetical protein
MRMSKRDVENVTKQPLGLVFEPKGDFTIDAGFPIKKELKIEDIHANASYYKVIGGEIVKFRRKQ